MINIPRYKVLFLSFDLIIIMAGLLLANITRIINFELGVSSDHLLILKLIVKLFVCASIILFVFRSNHLYKINVILKRKLHSIKLISALFKILILSFIISSLFDNFVFFKTSVSLQNFIFLCLSYFVLRVYLFTEFYRFISKKYFRNNILLVGNGNFAKIISAEFFINNSLPINIIGLLNDNAEVGKELIPGIKILGKLSELKSVIQTHNIDEVILSYDEYDYSKIISKLDELEDINVRVRVSSELFNSINEKSNPESYYEVPLLDIHTSNNSGKIRKFILYKRTFDLFFASIGVVLLSPIYMITFLLVRFTSKGPAIYAQERVGLNGKKFKFYKFRSMTIDDNDDQKRKEDMLKFISTNKEGNDEFKVINEKRLTKVGKFIRKTSIDELPQLFNVIKGDMSLVGPRPCLPYEYDNYKNWQKKRLNVLPGCTGFWQIFGRNKVSFLDSTVMDIYYTYVMSPLNDLEYIVKTLPAMILAKGK